MKFREKLTRFMIGRYGTDPLNRFLSIFTIVVLLLAVLLTGTALGLLLQALGVVGLVWSVFRTFSRQLEKRRLENDGYLRIKGRLTGGVRGARSRFQQRKDYRFFRCPSCKTWLRVPRGKGRLSITCRQCVERFTKST